MEFVYKIKLDPNILGNFLVNVVDKIVPTKTNPDFAVIKIKSIVLKWDPNISQDQNVFICLNLDNFGVTNGVITQIVQDTAQCGSSPSFILGFVNLVNGKVSNPNLEANMVFFI